MADLTYKDIKVGDTIKIVRSDIDHVIKSITERFRGIEVVPYYGTVPSLIDIDEVVSVVKKPKKTKKKQETELSLKEVISLLKEFKVIETDMEIGLGKNDSIAHPHAPADIIAFKIPDSNPARYLRSDVLQAIENINEYRKENIDKFNPYFVTEAYIDKRGFPVHEDDAEDRDDLEALVSKSVAIKAVKEQHKLYLDSQAIIKQQEKEIEDLKSELSNTENTYKP